MPKEAFFNLAQEKQDRILSAALDEFIEYKDNYAKASVKRIAKNADIAIGSIYKYFNDKNDLFFYLFDQSKGERGDVSDADTLVSYTKKLSTPIVNSSETHQTLMDIIMKNRDSLFHTLIFDDTPESQLFAEVCSHIEKDRANGLIRKDVDTEMAAYMFFSLEFISNNYCQRKGLDYNLDEEIFDRFLDIFFYGIYKESDN